MHSSASIPDQRYLSSAIAIFPRRTGDTAEKPWKHCLSLPLRELNINRFWLDAYPDNTVGIHLYESLGMHRDGVLRQNYKSERGYLDQIIFSMLKDEYFQ